MLNYSFDPIISQGIVFIMLIIFLLILISVEILRRKKSRLFLRIILNVVLTLSLGMIILRPETPQTIDNPEAIIVTKDADQSVIDSLQSKSMDIYYYNDSIRNIEIPEFVDKSYSKVNIVGEGLESWDLQRITDTHLLYYPSKMDGIYDLDYNPYCFVGESSTISFRIKTLQSDTIFALLKSQGRTLDSIQIISNTGDNAVELGFRPELEGNYIYTLEVLSGTRTTSEKLGIQILQREPVKVLISNDFPSFELKYLKDLLKEEGFPVASRFKVGKNDYSTEFSNIEKSRIKVLSEDVFAKFDVLVTTTSSYYGLSQFEKSTIRKSVESGMGLILLMDQELRSEFPFNNLEFEVFEKSELDVTIPNSKSVLQTSNKGYNESLKVFPVLISNTNEILSGYVVRKLGKAGFVNLKDMFSLKLQGENEDYTQLIIRLVEGVRKREQDRFWRYDKQPLINSVPVSISLISLEKEIPEVIIKDPNNRSKVRYMKQSFWDDFIWETNYTPSTSGWHSIVNAKDSTSLSWFYVSESNSWKSNTQSNSIDENMVASFLSIDNSNQKTITRYSRLNDWIWYTLFVLSAGLLWLESKM